MGPPAYLIALVLSLCMPGNILAAMRSDEMRVTLLGTGTPFPNAERFGSAILIEAADKLLLFECGRGVVIRLTQARVSPKEIDGLLLTHLHSNHVVGIPDLWLSGWFLGRSEPLPIWGPEGTSSMVEHLVRAFALDMHIRQAVPDPLPAKGVQIDAEEVAQGEIYNDGLTRVSAFLVDHGTVKLFGYRIEICRSLGSHLRRYEVLSEPCGFRQGHRLFDSCCLECQFEELHAAVSALNRVCRGCRTSVRDCEAQARCRLSLQE